MEKQFASGIDGEPTRAAQLSSKQGSLHRAMCPMPSLKYGCIVSCLSSIFLVLCGCKGVTSTPPPPASVQLGVQSAGTGTGMIISTPGGINCGQGCSASFASGTKVTLTETAAPKSFFAGWTGACSGSGSTCTLMGDCAVLGLPSAKSTRCYQTPVVPDLLSGVSIQRVARLMLRATRVR